MAQFGNPSFDVFKLPDEHDELRVVLRDLCEKEIAPHAADVDERARLPEEALKVLSDSDFAAVHVTEQHGGQGVDAIATATSSSASNSVRPSMISRRAIHGR